MTLNQQDTMQKELKKVSEEELTDLFRSRKFKELLKKSALYTFNKGHESGFIIVRDIKESRLYYSKVARGGTDEISKEMKHIKIPNFGDERENEDIYTILNLHFHPDVQTYVCPSGPESFYDLQYDLGCFTGLKDKERVNCKPICAVGQIDFNKNIELILLQEQMNEPLTHSLLVDAYSGIAELIESRHPYTTEDVLKEFNQTRLYKSTSLEFRLNGKDVLISDDELEKVRIFAYTPKLK